MAKMLEELAEVYRIERQKSDEMTKKQAMEGADNRKRILFVCTGNTCRSPMAAAVYNARYAGMDSLATSAGLAADGSGISRNAALALAAEGILSEAGNAWQNHISHTVTETDVASAAMVVGITSRHAMSLIFAFPEAAGKITSLPMDIPDPYGGDEMKYGVCLAQIETALEVMFGQHDENGAENHDK